MSDRQDDIYAHQHDVVEAFRFDEQVVNVFPDMIRRSVPGYPTIISMIGYLAERYAQPGSHCYDLGCSLGAASLSMRDNIPHADCKIIALDNSQAMVEKCRVLLLDQAGKSKVDVKLGDIRQQEIKNASVVVLNFTLQFIDRIDRDLLIQKIYDGLKPGGILILSEKLAFSDGRVHDMQTDMYYNFKRLNGYSEMEISQKRNALENVLTPDTLEVHQQRLRQSGFASCDVWFQCFNFCSMVAIKV